MKGQHQSSQVSQPHLYNLSKQQYTKKKSGVTVSVSTPSHGQPMTPINEGSVSTPTGSAAVVGSVSNPSSTVSTTSAIGVSATAGGSYARKMLSKNAMPSEDSLPSTAASSISPISKSEFDIIAAMGQAQNQATDRVQNHGKQCLKHNRKRKNGREEDKNDQDNDGMNHSKGRKQRDRKRNDRGQRQNQGGNNDRYQHILNKREYKGQQQSQIHHSSLQVHQQPDPQQGGSRFDERGYRHIEGSPSYDQQRGEVEHQLKQRAAEVERRHQDELTYAYPTHQIGAQSAPVDSTQSKIGGAIHSSPPMLPPRVLYERERTSESSFQSAWESDRKSKSSSRNTPRRIYQSFSSLHHCNEGRSSTLSQNALKVLQNNDLPDFGRVEHPEEVIGTYDRHVTNSARLEVDHTLTSHGSATSDNGSCSSYPNIISLETAIPEKDNHSQKCSPQKVPIKPTHQNLKTSYSGRQSIDVAHSKAYDQNGAPYEKYSASSGSPNRGSPDFHTPHRGKSNGEHSSQDTQNRLVPHSTTTYYSVAQSKDSYGLQGVESHLNDSYSFADSLPYGERCDLSYEQFNDRGPVVPRTHEHPQEQHDELPRHPEKQYDFSREELPRYPERELPRYPERERARYPNCTTRHPDSPRCDPNSDHPDFSMNHQGLEFPTDSSSLPKEPRFDEPRVPFTNEPRVDFTNEPRCLSGTTNTGGGSKASGEMGGSGMGGAPPPSSGGPPAGGPPPGGPPPPGGNNHNGSGNKKSNTTVTPQNPHPKYDNVVNVYSDNVHDAIAELSEMDYLPLIGVECFFPGLVLRPTIPVDSFLEHHYATLRSNVDCTNLIQLDLTIRKTGKTEDGERYKTFRFHFQYNLHNELYSVDAMRKLVEAGSFQNPAMQSKRVYIDTRIFAELLMTTGLILNEDLTWLPIFGLMIPFDARIESLPDYKDRIAKDINPAQIFRGLYDLAHLVQLLQGRTGLPERVEDFFKELDVYFPKRCIVSFHDYTSLFFSRSNDEAVNSMEKYLSGQYKVGDGKPPGLVIEKKIS